MAPQNHSSNIIDHCLQIIREDMKIMKKFAILWELPKIWHSDTKWANTVGKIARIDSLNRVARNFQFVKGEKKYYLGTTVKQSPIKWGCLFSHAFEVQLSEQAVTGQMQIDDDFNRNSKKMECKK